MNFVMQALPRIFCVLTLALCCILPSPGTAADSPPIVIAALFAKTGVAVQGSRSNLLGAQLAAEHVNASGGILGRPLDLVVIDTRSTPLGAREAAMQAVKAGAVGVIGPTWSSQCMAVAPVLQKAHVPMITPSGTAMGITEVGNYIFRACLTNDQMAKGAALFCRNTLKADCVSVLTNVDEIYSRDLSQRFEESFVALGGKIVLNSAYRRDAVDFSDQLSNVLSEAPDAIFLPGYEKDSALILRHAEKLGIRIPVVGADAFLFLSDLYTGKIPVYMVTGLMPGLQKDRAAVFDKTFRARYPQAESNTFLAAEGYDALMLMVQAIRRAQVTNPEAVRNALAATKGYIGASGKVSFDETGNTKNKAVRSYELTNQKWTACCDLPPQPAHAHSHDKRGAQ